MKEIKEFSKYFQNCSSNKQEAIINQLYELMHQSTSSNIKDDTQIKTCPHCQSEKIAANGKNKGIQRYKCNDCGKNYSETTGTPLAWLKKKNKWTKYLHSMLMGYSIRKCAEEVGISIQTSFDWRHKVLCAFKTASAERYSGILETDDFFFLESEKGSKQLSRPSRKRGTKAKKAGINDEQISVIAAVDRNGNKDLKVSNKGRMSKADLEKVFENKIDQKVILCSDSHPSITAFAKSKKLKHKKIKANKGQYVKDKIYHIQNTNNTIKRLRDWMKPFNGVATKYLQNYMNWFLVLEKLKESNAKMNLLIAFSLSTHEAWFDFKNIAIDNILFRT